MDSFYTFIYEQINKKEPEQLPLYIDTIPPQYYEEAAVENEETSTIIIIELF